MNDLKINSSGKLVDKEDLFKLLTENIRREIRDTIDNEIIRDLENWASVNKEE